MDVKLKLKRNTERSDKVMFAVAATSTSILALCAAILSYSALRELAIQAGFSETLSYLFPITLDGLIISGSAMTLFAADRGERSWGGIGLTALGVIGSIVGNIAVSDNTLTAQAVHAVPPTVLFLSLEGLTSLMRRRINESIARDEILLQEESESSVTHSNAKDIEKQSNPAPELRMPVVADSQTEPKKKPVSAQIVYPSSPPAERQNPSVSTASTPQTGEQQVQRDVVEPTTSTEPSITPKPARNENQKDSGKTSKMSIPAQARALISEHPNKDIAEIAEMIDGKDRKYVRRAVKNEMEKN